MTTDKALPGSSSNKNDLSRAAQEEWAKRTAEWQALAPGVTLPDNIDPKDVRVEIGPPMTAEEFKAWHEKRKKFAKTFS